MLAGLSGSDRVPALVPSTDPDAARDDRQNMASRLTKRGQLDYVVVMNCFDE
jgi:hypothetical protein